MKPFVKFDFSTRLLYVLSASKTISFLLRDLFAPSTVIVDEHKNIYFLLNVVFLLVHKLHCAPIQEFAYFSVMRQRFATNKVRDLFTQFNLYNFYW